MVIEHFGNWIIDQSIISKVYSNLNELVYSFYWFNYRNVRNVFILNIPGFSSLCMYLVWIAAFQRHHQLWNFGELLEKYLFIKLNDIKWVIKLKACELKNSKQESETNNFTKLYDRLKKFRIWANDM